MNAKQREKWEKTRQKGQVHFILRGTLFYGLGVTLLSFLADYAFEFFFRDTPDYLHESNNFIGKVLVRLFAVSLVGFYLFYSLWNKNEEQFFQNSEEK